MLVVHRAASAAVLAGALGEVLRTPQADPFAREVVAVPAKGVERWLAQRLSHVLGAAEGDGVCAAVEFPSPADLVDRVVQATCPEAGEAVARWSPRRAAWSLVEVMDACAGEPWCASLRQHVLGPADTTTAGSDGEPEDRGRRLRVAARLARLYDTYAQARPEVMRAWVDGRVGSDTQGGGLPVPEDLAWQPELWRRLRDHLGVPSPAELLERACDRLRDGVDVPDLPSRLSVFGASRLSAARLAVLAALVEHRDVHLWLHHPSPALWAAGRGAPVVLRRRDDTTRARLRNPLLASLARDLLELQELLQRTCGRFEDVHHPSPPADVAGTLLGRLQADLAADAVPPAPPPLDPDDRSVQVHACHGRTRQVEVLREAVLGLLRSDPSLEPRDVLVMCPDVEAFAPLVAAAFAQADEPGAEEAPAHPAARLRVRIADRSPRQTNPLLAVLADLLDLGTGRMTATQVLDLAGGAAVRRRFRFDDDEVERLRDWVAGGGVRWGLDAGHRAAWQLRGIVQGTWREGLDRLLAGAATADPVDGLVPLDDIDSADIDLAGRFAELLDRLAAGQELLAGHRTIDEWCDGLQQVVLSLAAPAPEAPWQELQLRGALADIAADAGGSPSRFGIGDLRAALEPLLAGRPTRSSFRTGGLTVCTLVPMRSVPHRVVCLLGLDDGVFPRQTFRDGDDLLAREPEVGERDPRSEDRQLLLDAIGSATQHLVVTYTGADERTGAPVPPAVPLGELLDALDRAASVDGGRVRDLIVVRHPLQPFDPRCFRDAALGVPGPFSFDPLAYRGAGADRGGGPGAHRAGAPLLSHPLPPRPPGDVELGELVRLLERPARGFLRQRLELAVVPDDEEPGDALPVELDALEDWQVGDRMLHDRIAGLTPQECKALEVRRGALPPGELGERVATELGRAVEEVVRASAAERVLDPEALDVDVRLRDGTRVVGTVGGVRGDVLLYVGFSRLGPRQRVRAWIELVALTAAYPERELRAVVVGRGSSGRDRGAARSVLGPLAPDDARRTLEELVALYRAGLRAPLPLPSKTAAVYAEQRFRGNSPAGALRQAERRWVSGRQYPGEQDEAEHTLLYGERVPLAVLAGERPWPGEGGPEWPAGEENRFGLLARRLWTPLLEAEVRALT